MAFEHERFPGHWASVEMHVGSLDVEPPYVATDTDLHESSCHGAPAR